MSIDQCGPQAAEQRAWHNARGGSPRGKAERFQQTMKKWLRARPNQPLITFKPRMLFATRDGVPISRNTFRTRIWRPAIAASGIDFPVRVHASATPTPRGSSPEAPTSKD